MKNLYIRKLLLNFQIIFEKVICSIKRNLLLELKTMNFFLITNNTSYFKLFEKKNSKIQNKSILIN